MTSPEPIIRVESLTVDFWDEQSWVNVVNGVSFDIYPGETLGLAGESGCGKSTTAFALFGYRRPGSRFRSGKAILNGQDVLSLDEQGLRQIRGCSISLVPQNPAGSLTPSMRIEDQVLEALQVHGSGFGQREARERVIQLFTEVGLPDPRVIGRRYPHQLSGGQQQRVIIAMALACNPDLVVLDEPSSALDVTIQAQILRLLINLQAKHGMSMLFVTHDLGVLAQISSRVAVMYAGEMVEVAPTPELYGRPRHPYTRGLIAAVPKMSAKKEIAEKLQGLLRREELPDSGCRFAPRCPYVRPQCLTQPQSLTTIAADHDVACWRWEAIETEAAEMKNGHDRRTE